MNRRQLLFTLGTTSIALTTISDGAYSECFREDRPIDTNNFLNYLNYLAKSNTCYSIIDGMTMLIYILYTSHFENECKSINRKQLVNLHKDIASLQKLLNQKNYGLNPDKVINLEIQKSKLDAFFKEKSHKLTKDIITIRSALRETNSVKGPLLKYLLFNFSIINQYLIFLKENNWLCYFYIFIEHCPEHKIKFII